MNSDYGFKKHQVSAAERLWLQEAARPGFFPRLGLEQLRGKIPEDFRPASIDHRLYCGDRIMPIGLWHVDSQHPDLVILDEVIRAIKARVPSENVEVTFTAAEIAEAIRADTQSVARAFQRLLDLGAGFFNQASGPASSGGEGFDCIQFVQGNLFDYYRKYQGLDDLLERAYTRPGRDFYLSELISPRANSEGSRPASPSEATPTVYDSTIRALKNRRLVVWILIGVAVVVGAADFLDAFHKILGIAAPTPKPARLPYVSEFVATMSINKSFDQVRPHFETELLRTRAAAPPDRAAADVAGLIDHYTAERTKYYQNSRESLSHGGSATKGSSGGHKRAFLAVNCPADMIIEDGTAKMVREEGACYGPDLLPDKTGARGTVSQTGKGRSACTLVATCRYRVDFVEAAITRERAVFVNMAR